MRISRIEATPLRLPYKEPFHWAQGIIEAAEVTLVRVETDDGLVGLGESMNSAAPQTTQLLIESCAPLLLGRSPFEINKLRTSAYRHLFAARGNCSAPRFGAMVLAGLDMALWDLVGKASGRAVHELIGGAVRSRVEYFGFPQGETAQAVGSQAKAWAEAGCQVIYAKIGRGPVLDLEIAREVRAAIGTRRLRLDANEAWDVMTARRMIAALSPYDPEFVEQPTPSASLAALADVRQSTDIPIAADQIAFTPEDVYRICQARAADLIVVGVHETGSVEALLKTAAIAEAAGLKICLHGVYESGVTTVVHNQLGANIPNLDDGNQYMAHFLFRDIVSKPSLMLQGGGLPVFGGPGWGFELDWDAVGEAAENHRAHQDEPA